MNMRCMWCLGSRYVVHWKVVGVCWPISYAGKEREILCTILNVEIGSFHHISKKKINFFFVCDLWEGRRWRKRCTRGLILGHHWHQNVLLNISISGTSSDGPTPYSEITTIEEFRTFGEETGHMLATRANASHYVEMMTVLLKVALDKRWFTWAILFFPFFILFLFLFYFSLFEQEHDIRQLEGRLTWRHFKKRMPFNSVSQYREASWIALRGNSLYSPDILVIYTLYYFT